MLNFTVIIPVLNQIQYTKMCVESLVISGCKKENILIINNASTDETESWLKEHDYPYITNPINLGCGGAWTQGALQALSSDWIIFLNNDVIVCKQFCERLLNGGELFKLDVVSPAMVESDLDYDFEAYSDDFISTMGKIVRTERAHGVCFAVRASVFNDIGFPDTDRRLGGHEDLEFFLRCKSANKLIGTIGGAFLHHYGSITQKALKKDSGVKSLGQRHIFYQKVGLSWLKRRVWKLRNKISLNDCIKAEMTLSSKTLHAIRREGKWFNI